MMKKNGFTLVELLIVMAVISIIAMTVLAVFNPLEQYKKGQDARKKSDLAQIQRSLEEFYNDYGRYPYSDEEYRIVDNDQYIEWGTPWVPYMNLLPKDPSGKRYIYYSPDVSNGQSYYLYASLERGVNDTEACGNGVCPDRGTGGMMTLCGGGACNYGVSSPNVSLE